MSFRTRLTSFFVVIVVLPMVAVGFLVFRLIGQSQQGKADARVSGLATAAGSLYLSEIGAARLDAATIARDVATLKGIALTNRVSALASRAGLARVTVTRGAKAVVDIGDPTAVAPGAATVSSGAASLVVTVSELTATEYAHDLLASGVVVVVREGRDTLSATSAAAGRRPFPRRGTVTVGGVDYRVVTLPLRGFAAPVELSVLSSLSSTAASGSGSRVLAAGVIAGFLLLALAFAMLASRQLQGQLGGFLQAARRLGAGDFSSPVPVEGRDEFAELGDEFNRMSTQLATRIEELAQERARLRESIRRIGQTFASNLDRPALLELALQTAVDAVSAESGRLSLRSRDDQSMSESMRVGSLAAVEDQVIEAETAALGNGGFAETMSEQVSVAAITLGGFEHGGHAHGLIAVARRGSSFNDYDRDILRSLASQATLALENVELHLQVSRQAVTDELTGLANHRRFQELLGLEMDQVRRYSHPVGLIMLDIDNFKSVNDTYGHPQGDIVLKHVARVVRDNSRDVDVPTRYGGEEMALILPHTDLEGAYAIAERIRDAVQALRIPRLDQQGEVCVTASAGVAASADGDKDELIADADAALYAAKRNGKNRTVRAQPQSANVFRAE